MRIQFYFLLAMLFSGCQKAPVQPGSPTTETIKTNPLPNPVASAILSGRITPFDQVTFLALQPKGSINEEVIRLVPDQLTGVFRFTGLNGGIYTLTPMFSSKHFRPVQYVIQLDSAAHVDMGTLEHQPASLYFIMNHSQQWGTANALLNPTRFSFLYSQTSGRHGELNFNQRRLSISFKPGDTYRTNEPGVKDSVQITYSEQSGNLISRHLEWSSTGGEANLTIDQVDTVQKVIQGRFSATLKPSNAATPNEQVINEGYFKTTYRSL